MDFSGIQITDEYQITAMYIILMVIWIADTLLFIIQMMIWIAGRIYVSQIIVRSCDSSVH